jgi:hypothetical protein
MAAPAGRRPGKIEPTGEPDNIELIATNVRIEGHDTVHRGASLATGRRVPACGAYVAFSGVILTSVPRTCRKDGCKS